MRITIQGVHVSLNPRMPHLASGKIDGVDEILLLCVTIGPDSLYQLEVQKLPYMLEIHQSPGMAVFSQFEVNVSELFFRRLLQQRKPVEYKLLFRWKDQYNKLIYR